jgi:hypothetical protein
MDRKREEGAVELRHPERDVVACLACGLHLSEEAIVQGIPSTSCPKHQGELVKQHQWTPKALIRGHPEADTEVLAEVVCAHNLRFDTMTANDLILGYLGPSNLESIVAQSGEVATMRVAIWSVALAPEISPRAANLVEMVARDSVAAPLFQEAGYATQVVASYSIRSPSKGTVTTELGCPEATSPTLLQKGLDEEQLAEVQVLMTDRSASCLQAWGRVKESAGMPIDPENLAQGYREDLRLLSQRLAFTSPALEGLAGAPGFPSPVSLLPRQDLRDEPERCVTQAGPALSEVLADMSRTGGGPLTCLTFGQLEAWDIMGQSPSAIPSFVLIDISVTLPFKVLWYHKAQYLADRDGWVPSRDQVFEALNLYHRPAFLSAFHCLCAGPDEEAEQVHALFYGELATLATLHQAISDLWDVVRRFGETARDILDQCALLVVARSTVVRLIERKSAVAARSTVARNVPRLRGEDAVRDNLCLNVGCERGQHSRQHSTTQFWKGSGGKVPRPEGVFVRGSLEPTLGVLSRVHWDDPLRVIIPLPESVSADTIRPILTHSQFVPRPPRELRDPTIASAAESRSEPMEVTTPASIQPPESHQQEESGAEAMDQIQAAPQPPAVPTTTDGQSTEEVAAPVDDDQSREAPVTLSTGVDSTADRLLDGSLDIETLAVMVASGSPVSPGTSGTRASRRSASTAEESSGGDENQWQATPTRRRSRSSRKGGKSGAKSKEANKG